MQARDPQTIGRNTVLAGREITFEMLPNDSGRNAAAEDLCVNLELRPVFQCNLDAGFCRLEGEKCMTYHASVNGHMFYQETSCI